MNASIDSTVIRTGRWTKAEMDYLEAIVTNFRDGKLDIPNGTTLRGYIAGELRCLVKRISKKMEGSSYNGRQRYERKLFDEAELNSKKKELLVLKERFEDSIEELRLQEEGSRFQGNNKGVQETPVLRADPPLSTLESDLVGYSNIADLLLTTSAPSSPTTSTNSRLLLLVQRLQAAKRLEELLAARATSQYINALQQLTTAAAAPPTPTPSPAALVLAAAAEAPPVTPPSPTNTTPLRLLSLLAATNNATTLTSTATTSALIPRIVRVQEFPPSDMPSSKRRRLG